MLDQDSLKQLNITELLRQFESAVTDVQDAFRELELANENKRLIANEIARRGAYTQPPFPSAP